MADDISLLNARNVITSVMLNIVDYSGLYRLTQAPNFDQSQFSIQYQFKPINPNIYNFF